MRAAVIGAPIAHSRSPQIFGFLAEELGLPDLSYAACEVQPAALDRWVGERRASGEWLGFNVTSPHKVAVAPLLDALAPEACGVGAVNVVHRDRGGLRGYNTDVAGAAQALAAAGIDMGGQRAWIWGAGGAARAVAYALGESRAEAVFLRSPNAPRAAALARDLGALFPRTRFLPVESAAEVGRRSLALAVNATPLGMAGVGCTREGEGPAVFFAPLAQLPWAPDAAAFDLIYTPARTPFLDLARAQGARLLGGLDMLIYQALETWRIWLGGLADGAGLAGRLRQHIRVQSDHPAGAGPR